jgi:hypothetical protein
VLQEEIATLLADRAAMTNRNEEMEKLMQEYSQTIEALMGMQCVSGARRRYCATCCFVLAVSVNGSP